MCVEKHEEGISIEYQKKKHNMICVENEAIFTPVFEGGSFIWFFLVYTVHGKSMIYIEKLR